MKIKERGSALLMALFITAIVAAVAYSILERAEINIKRTSLLLNANQAFLYVAGTQIWAAHLLTTDIYKPTEDNPTPFISWPKQMPEVTLPPNGKVVAQLIDAQSYFNLNNVTETDQQTAFMHLVTQVDPTLDENTILPIIRAVTAWISVPGQNADVVSESYYLSHEPPYQSAHQPFVSVTELRLVKGISSSLYNALSPYIIALPEKTPLNVNTASMLTLSTLGSGLSADQVQQIIDLRDKQGGFTKVEEVSGLPFMKGNQNTQPNIEVTSQYFLLRSDVIIDGQQLTVFSLFHRKPQEKKPALVTLIWQSIGTL